MHKWMLDGWWHCKHGRAGCAAQCCADAEKDGTTPLKVVPRNAAVTGKGAESQDPRVVPKQHWGSGPFLFGRWTQALPDLFLAPVTQSLQSCGRLANIRLERWTRMTSLTNFVGSPVASSQSFRLSPHNALFSATLVDESSARIDWKKDRKSLARLSIPSGRATCPLPLRPRRCRPGLPCWVLSPTPLAVLPASS